MLGFGKKRKARQQLIAAIQADAKRTRAHLAAQALFAMEHLGRPGPVIWEAPYSRGYIYGAFAALLDGTAADEALSTEMIGSGFVSFAANAFSIREEEARDALAALVARANTAPLRHAIADGRADGRQMRDGLPATLWLAHLAERQPVG